MVQKPPLDTQFSDDPEGHPSAYGKRCTASAAASGPRLNVKYVDASAAGSVTQLTCTFEMSSAIGGGEKGGGGGGVGGGGVGGGGVGGGGEGDGSAGGSGGGEGSTTHSAHPPQDAKVPHLVTQSLGWSAHHESHCGGGAGKGGGEGEGEGEGGEGGGEGAGGGGEFVVAQSVNAFGS